MQARTSMTRDVIVVGPGFPLALAWALMKARRIRHLPVVSAGRLVGILSDRDILLRATVDDTGEVTVPLDPVATAMTPSPATCGADAQVSRLARIMVDLKIDAIPVVSAKAALIGLVTSTDLLLLVVDDEASARVLPFDFRLHEGELLVA